MILLKFPVGYIFRKVLNGDDMTITLYKISDDRIVINKHTDTQHKLGELTAHFKEDTDVLNPVLEIAYNASYSSANYVYVSAWNRYYYITGIKTGMQRMFLTCEVDVLMSYKEDIKKLNCIVSRQADKNFCNLYLNDGIFKALQSKQIVPLPFPNSFDGTGSLVLVVGGE